MASCFFTKVFMHPGVYLRGGTGFESCPMHVINILIYYLFICLYISKSDILFYGFLVVCGIHYDNARAHTHTHTYIHTYKTSVHGHMHTHTHTYIHIRHTCMDTYTNTHMYRTYTNI